MVSALVSEWSGLGSSKTLDSHSTSLHLGVEMDTSEFNVGATLRSTSIPFKEEVEILLVAPWYRDQVTALWATRLLSLYLTFVSELINEGLILSQPIKGKQTISFASL